MPWVGFAAILDRKIVRLDKPFGKGAT
ncbi:hypothetical protein ELI_04855 [Erythrobacter litoralis HTCC2594]|uniref:Uncharacterized protein n=1 Tax=Erythrobacter litoralis (strain HTCC2594) TaxID=314225 RepID=Q2NB78_ERYLH|nr:hypothetical protein ELI_04855 [Erythrobacter litoralis HTCC2594]